MEVVGESDNRVANEVIETPIPVPKVVLVKDSVVDVAQGRDAK